MDVDAYSREFERLACYAPEKVSTDAKKQARFRKGLNPKLAYYSWVFEHPRACSSWVLWCPRQLLVPRSSIIVVQISGQASGSPIRLWRLPRAFEVISEPQSIVVKLRGVVGSLQFSCGDCPNLVCKGSVAAFKGTNSGITTSRIV